MQEKSCIVRDKAEISPSEPSSSRDSGLLDHNPIAQVTAIMMHIRNTPQVFRISELATEALVKCYHADNKMVYVSRRGMDIGRIQNRLRTPKRPRVSAPELGGWQQFPLPCALSPHHHHPASTFCGRYFAVDVIQNQWAMTSPVGPSSKAPRSLGLACYSSLPSRLSSLGYVVDPAISTWTCAPGCR